MKRTSTAVMNRRAAPDKGLDFFPTPPWATRAFLHEVLLAEFTAACCQSVWEPAAGDGHMVHVLSEVFPKVFAGDVEDYGRGFEVGSFVGQGPDVIAGNRGVDWVITNPPFNLATEFVERAMTEARTGVALLLRTNWLEGGDRFERVFSKMPPRIVAVYSERVPMVAGKWDPAAASATSYSWFVWQRSHFRKETKMLWISPGAKQRHWKSDDLKRWAA